MILLQQNLEYNQTDHEWIKDNLFRLTSHASMNANLVPNIEKKKAEQVAKFKEEKLHLEDETQLLEHIQRCKEYRLYSSVQEWLGM